MGRVIAAIRGVFPGDPEEITVEANPNDCAPERLAALREIGVDRISIGAQAFDDDGLARLGRDHDAAAALGAVARARAAGFARVSLDLIFALPGRTLADWRRTLERAIAAAPDHMSVYQLTIEDRTTFGAARREGRLVPEPDDACAEQFELADELLGAAGYEHYEVSSYARPGMRARHNAAYWRGVEYLGLGNGAHSFQHLGDGGVRWSNHRSVVRYLAGEPRESLEDADEVLPQTAAEREEDLVWLGVRTSDGIPEALAEAGAADRLVAGGLLVRDGGRLRPTRRGLLLADAIGATLMRTPAS
jgi:oxygen-independent coproporphyrinogen-3 oxidase